MDGELPSQETPGSTETTCQSDNNNNQTNEPELGENKDLGGKPPAGETAEGQGVMEVGEDDSGPQQGVEEDTSAGDTDKPKMTASKHAEGETEESGYAKDKDSTAVDVKDTEATRVQRDEQGEKEKGKKGGRVEETVKDVAVKDKKNEREKRKKEEKTKETDKDVNDAAGKGAEKKNGTKEVDVETKKKEKIKEAEKPKRKGGPPPPSLTRPKPSARSIRASAKNEIIAKFQQGAPETSIPRNFKIQRSGRAGATGATIKQKILHWCQNKTRKYEGVNIENFSSTWCDGLAFCALIHRFFPDAFDYGSLTPKDRRKNLTLAFETAESLADCCPLLEVDDMLMMGNNPDPMCVFTYVQALCHSLSKIEAERKDKETGEKDKAGDERGANKGDDGAVALSSQRDEDESGENGTMKIQEERQGDVAETEGTEGEENAPHRCEMRGDGDVLVETES